MPVPATISEFIDSVRQCGVVDLRRLDTFLEQQAPLPESPAKLAEALVEANLLTNFQAELLLQGKQRRFIISGKYKLLDRLGSGGMASVYLCEHRVMRRRVAIKVLPPNMAENPEALTRFHREARACAMLDHPNIVRAHDVDQDGKLHFLVIEYIEGSNLNDLVKKAGPLEIHRAAHYISQAAQGLQHAHELGLVHRDIKPANLLIDRYGTVKILDLGLALFFHDDDNLTKQVDASAVLGTADYLAPEQAIDSHAVDIRADIYSLGVTFYYLLTGKAPFSDGTVAQKLIWHHMRKPKPVSEIRPDVPPEVEAILEKMMAKEVSERYQTPKEVVEALRPWTNTVIAPPSEDELPKPLAPLLPDSSDGSSQLYTAAALPTPLDTMVPSRGSTTAQTERLSPARAPRPASAVAAEESDAPTTVTARTPLPSKNATPKPRSGPPPAPQSGVKVGGPKSSAKVAAVAVEAEVVEADVIDDEPRSRKSKKKAVEEKKPSMAAIVGASVAAGLALAVLSVVVYGFMQPSKLDPSKQMPKDLPPPKITVHAPPPKPPEPKQPTSPPSKVDPKTPPPKQPEPKQVAKADPPMPKVDPNVEPKSPPPPAAPTASADFFFPLKAAKEPYTYDRIDYLPKPTATRLKYDIKDNGVVEMQPMNRANYLGASLVASPPTYPTKPITAKPSTFHIRLNDAEKTMDIEAGPGLWEPALKIGAKVGDTWTTKLPDGTDVKYTLKSFGDHKGKRTAVVERVMTVQQVEQTQQRTFAQGLGLIEERISAKAPTGAVQLISEMRRVD